MSDLEDLQKRLVSALDRIGVGARALSDNEGERVGKAALEQALEEERLTNAQLEERLRALHAKHDDEMATLRAEVKRSRTVSAASGGQEQSAALTQLDEELQRLRAANEQLRQSNAALREANQAGVGEPHLINKAMLAELEGLRAARATDVAEARAILSQLEPMLTSAEGGTA